ncbi:MAG TPA: FHA domain-containing protein [Pyrinomonadaceae bacterium]|jgi:hypothetical protein|nr:FHA domain-containing protein [Pyrinomonadaceae bacterium]
MTEISLTINSADGKRELTFAGNRIVIGRAGQDLRDGGNAGLLINDAGLARRHASINREDERIWVLDEGSSDGTFVNGRRVPPQGLPLADDDEIFLGEQTTITLHTRANISHEEQAPEVIRRAPLSRLSLTLAVVVPLLCLAVLAVLFSHFSDKPHVNSDGQSAPRVSSQVASQTESSTVSPDSPDASSPGDGATVAGSQLPDETSRHSSGDNGITEDSVINVDASTSNASQSQHGAKLYLQMSNEEQLQFLEQRAQHISILMGNRPYAFNDEVLGYIKQYVDVYARRVGNNSHRLWGEDLRFVFARAHTKYAPDIIRAFNARNVPPVCGLYIAMIETEYNNIGSENGAGAAGLFQFIGPTARLYGVEPSERTNIEKMAPAAARYMGDRIAEFGPDSMSVALAIAGYNRSPDSVRRDLREVLNDRNRERSFWTLVANSNKLDHWFQNENVKYVPKFFAAAIVGENPEAFGLQMRKLSTYTAGPPANSTEERPAGALTGDKAP